MDIISQQTGTALLLVHHHKSSKAPKKPSLWKASHRLLTSSLPPPNRATAHREGNQVQKLVGREGGGEYLPPILGTSFLAFCMLPMSSEAVVGAGQSGDLREVWKTHPKGNGLPFWDRRKGYVGEMLSTILNHTYK